MEWNWKNSLNQADMQQIAQEPLLNPTYGDAGLEDLRTPEQQQQVDYIRARIQANRARIEQLKAKLAGINDDALDRKLAANRASVGDIGSAMGHMNRIDSRFNARTEKERQNKLEIEDLQRKVRNVDTDLSFGGLNGAQIQKLKADRDYYNQQIIAKGGQPMVEATTVDNNQTSTTDFKTFMANSTDKSGRFTGKTAQEAIDNRNKAAAMALLAGGEDAAATAKKIMNTKTSFEQKASNDKKYKDGADAFNSLTDREKANANENKTFMKNGIKYSLDQKTGKWYKG